MVRTGVAGYTLFVALSVSILTIVVVLHSVVFVLLPPGARDELRGKRTGDASFYVFLCSGCIALVSATAEREGLETGRVLRRQGEGNLIWFRQPAEGGEGTTDQSEEKSGEGSDREGEGKGDTSGKGGPGGSGGEDPGDG